MDGKKIYVLVKNYCGINDDVRIFDSQKAAKRAFRIFTGFAHNNDYQYNDNERFSEKYSETKIYEIELPYFLEFAGSKRRKAGFD